MNGTFRITLAYLKELGACRDGQRAFQKAFPDGGEYQEVLDRCAEEGRLDFAGWLFSHVGPTKDVRTYSEDIIEPDKNIFFAGWLEFSGSVSVKRIQAGEGIEAGEGYCVFAGVRVPMSSWESLAVVTAKSKPNNLRSGYWKPLEGSDEKTQ